MDGVDGGHPDANERRQVAEGDDGLSGGHTGRRHLCRRVGALVPHDNEMELLAALALAVAPAALVVAINPRYSAATFTAVMVFFGPTITHTGPIASAVERVIEVAVGGMVGLFVSLLVLPARAHDLGHRGRSPDDRSDHATPA